MSALARHPCAALLFTGVAWAQAVPAAANPGAELKAVIDAGHEWLKRHQDEDGRWSAGMFHLHDPRRAPSTGVGKPDQDVFVTALVVKACYGIGQRPDAAGTHGHVCRALSWLQAQAQDDGSIGGPGSTTIVRDTAVAAWILSGAHRYHPEGTPGADLSKTVERLRAWRKAELWPRLGEAAAPDWLTSTLATGFFGEGGVETSDPSVIDQIAALAPVAGKPATGAAYLATWVHRDPARRTALCDLLVAELPAAGRKVEDVDYLGWYFTTQAMQFHDAAKWSIWWQALVQAGKAMQRTDGSCAGSWDPGDLRGREGGRVYATAAMLLALEVVWRKQYRDK